MKNLAQRMKFKVQYNGSDCGDLANVNIPKKETSVMPRSKSFGSES